MRGFRAVVGRADLHVIIDTCPPTDSVGVSLYLHDLISLSAPVSLLFLIVVLVLAQKFLDRH